MPHDRDGALLVVGDLVNIPARITGISSTGSEYCNLNLETVEKMYPGDYKSSVPLNAKQVVKVVSGFSEVGSTTEAERSQGV
jgi:hypothetical protein